MARVTRGHPLRLAFVAACALAVLVAPLGSPATFRTRGQRLLPSDNFPYDFGRSVAISGDTAVVGAFGARSAYVFVHSGDTWTQQKKLTTVNGSTGDFFGWAVAISDDTAVIGAFGDDDAGVDAGAAYIFVRSGDTWTQQAKLTAPGGASGNPFGYSVAIKGDTAVIGAHNFNTDSGSAYAFVRSGSVWTQQAELIPADGTEGDSFGHSVAISGDTVVVGAFTDRRLPVWGSAHIFVRTGTTWSTQARLIAPDESSLFALNVAIDEDTALIGSYSDPVWAFTRSGTNWTRQSRLVPTGGVPYRFGSAVAIDGDTAVVGAFGDDENGLGAGAAYVFNRLGTRWVQQAKLTASPARILDFFGFSAALSGDHAVVGGDYFAYAYELLCDGGLRALDGTPAEGAVSAVVHENVEPAVESIDSALAREVHNRNCTTVSSIEGRIDSVL